MSGAAATARVIDGAGIAADVAERVADGVAALAARSGRPPGLATVLVGEDPASQIYVRRKREACEKAGIRSIHHALDVATRPDELLDLVAELNADDGVDGILVQLPLPPDHDPDLVTAAISPSKDVDGLTPTNAGLLAQGRAGVDDDDAPGVVPCTPAGVMEILRHEGIAVEGADAVVLGRSRLVGRPLAGLLIAANATVTVCHTRTRDLAGVCSRADLLVAAAGVPRLVTPEMVKPGATVIDVGTNRTDEGLVGDVDFESVREVAGAITPVPGGVGPMTIAMLLANTLRAARARAA
ncbi:MAG TPA: bifunctional 5,10-methylenetetrahydrofolate dehydrogenase/5,10-methenyltetrahydrofolate cyclohydrolase [Solirubrobacterales bacterium]|nr:bifunctional 5,10-methylenetetrahydrofolate dehydrogenase/5,10-methenyltetrahydrofolate cyclohydrolase [Solirubrobacterales bacterium]